MKKLTPLFFLFYVGIVEAFAHTTKEQRDAATLMYLSYLIFYVILAILVLWFLVVFIRWCVKDAKEDNKRTQTQGKKQEDNKND